MPSPPAVCRPSSLGLFAVLVVFVLSLLMIEESAAQNRLPQCPESRKVVWTNCHGTMKYSDGTYTGGWLNDQWHGQGHLRTDAGVNYKGQFANHKYHGKGTLILPIEDYVGDFHNGLKQGKGRIVNKKTGVVYEGDFVAGKLHGMGVFIDPKGYKYSGQFKDGNMNGHGEFEDGIGNKYVGSFVNGKWEGRGTLTSADGAVYTGNFKDNQRNGSGTIKYPGGAIYIGQWKDNVRHGNGEFTIGSLRYVGQWENDKPHGHGSAVDGGFRYSGSYRNGMKHGHGERILPDGSKYVGEFFENKYHGAGRLISAAGAVLKQGNWSNDEFVIAPASNSSNLLLQNVAPLPSPIEFQIAVLTSVNSAQLTSLQSAPASEKGSVEATLKIVTEKLEALKKELASTPALNTGYLTSVRPDNANSYITARRASELYPKIPYYIPGTRETGEFWIEPVISKVGEMTFALKFVDVGSTSVEKVRGQIDMTLSETEEAQKARYER